MNNELKVSMNSDVEGHVGYIDPCAKNKQTQNNGPGSALIDRMQLEWPSGIFEPWTCTNSLWHICNAPSSEHSPHAVRNPIHLETGDREEN